MEPFLTKEKECDEEEEEKDLKAMNGGVLSCGCEGIWVGFGRLDGFQV